MKAFIKFNRGLLQSSAGVKVWLMILVGANLIAPLVFISRLEAQVVAGTFMASAMLMTYLTGRFGFSRILGLGHALWVPMLVFLAMRLDDTPAVDAYGYWLRALMVVNAISLFIDFIDVRRFIRGEREELAEGI